MDKKLLQKLVETSYTNGKLDAQKANAIADKLDRSNLKEYIKGLKEKERKVTVVVDIPSNNQESYKQELTRLFPDKKIIMRTDPSLILGIRITDNDTVYDLNLQSTLSKMSAYVEEAV